MEAARPSILAGIPGGFSIRVCLAWLGLVAGVASANDALPAEAASLEAALQDGGPVEPGRIYTFSAPLDGNQYAQARTFGNPKVEAAACALSVPAGFDPARPWPVFIVCTTGDLHASNLVSMRQYVGPATEAGYLVLAADGPVKPKRDSVYWRWAMKGASLDALHRVWPQSREWPMAVGGYSGGAKMAGQYGPMLAGKGYAVIGIYMGGCNEDYVSPNLRRARDRREAMLEVPLFLCLGERDRIARPGRVRQVAEFLAETGFRHIRVETHPGGHRFNERNFAAALRWFLMEGTPPGYR